MRIGTPAVEIHGRYLVESPGGPGPYPWIVGFHGYGEHAGIHLDRLVRIPGAAGWLRVAVQGLHRFYNTKTDQVVASWMTREDRELAIADNQAYVRRVLDEVAAEAGAPEALVLSGFSQGVAMAWRAAVSCGRRVDGLILLAGDVPPDLAVPTATALPRVLLGRGRTDAWYTQARLDEDLNWLRARHASVDTCVFDGGHEWGPAFLERSGQFLAAMVR